ncbi:unnamed protein product [Owenia fusiformis]|uniref:Uncharacterized protein n=1 Tax=Owenia fusiformis TaxID=6347 RepID=A0A8S4NNK4_OWEFU|nr:unnamed protein product [Owenia fusiformis]
MCMDIFKCKSTNQNNKMDGKNMIATVKEFTENTSAHGCGQIPTSKFKLTKFLWGLIFVGFFMFATISSVNLITIYFTFPTKDVVSVNFEDIEFPAVTFCTQQPVTATALIDFIDNQSHRDDAIGKLVLTMGSFPGMLVKPNIGGLGDWYFKYSYRFLSNQFVFENLDKKDLKTIQHDLKSLKISCKFKGHPCKDSAFVVHQDGGFQHCFTFNGAGAQLNDTKVIKADPTSGLSLILFVDAYTTKRDLSELTLYNPFDPTSGQSGVRVIIHSPKTRPMPFEKGFDIPTGFSTSVALKETKRELMTEPHGNCTMAKFNGGTNYAYSEDTCLEQCKQKILIENCRCMSSLLPTPSGELKPQYCGKVNVTNMFTMMYGKLDATMRGIAVKELEMLDCETKLMESLGNSEVLNKCECKKPCVHTNYVKMLSQAVWPSDYNQKNFLAESINMSDPTQRATILFEGLDIGQITKNESEMIQKNFLRFNVYFESLQVKTTSQVEDFPASTLISEIGGNMGFYVGISIITLMEMLTLTGAIILYCFKDLIIKCGQSNTTKVPDVNIKQIKSYDNHMDEDKENINAEIHG